MGTDNKECFRFFCLLAGILFCFFILFSCTGQPKVANNAIIEEVSEVEEPYIFKRVLKDERVSLPHYKNEDFFLHVEVLSEGNKDSNKLKKMTVHFIPEGRSRYKVEMRLEMEGHSTTDENGMEVWHEIIYPPENEFVSKGYVDELPFYSELLRYYFANMHRIEILKDGVGENPEIE